MLSTRYEDDEPDVIDLTKSYGYYGSLNFPIRPPSPFADNPRLLRSETNDNPNGSSVAIMYSSPSKYTESTSTITNHEENKASIFSHTNIKWRQTLSRFLKRAKSTEHKKEPTNISVSTQLYNFGNGETPPRTIVKRVHWIDDDEVLLDKCNHFIECLKLFVVNVINNQHYAIYLTDCQTSLSALDPLIDCKQIRKSFEQMVESASKKDIDQMLQQETFIENLLSHTLLLSSA